LPRSIRLADLNANREAIERVHADLRVIYGTPLYLALTLYQGRRGVEVGQGYMFKWPAALNSLFDPLRGMDQLTQGEPVELHEAPRPSERRVGGRAGAIRRDLRRRSYMRWQGDVVLQRAGVLSRGRERSRVLGRRSDERR
jgi:hypothetical protein